VIAPFYNVSFAVGDYRRMMELISETEFESDRLKELKALYQGKTGALSAFTKLGVICQAYNVVYNPLIHQLLSGILLWDYQLACSTAKWKKRYGKQMGAAFEGIYEMEFLMSLAVLPNVRSTSAADITAPEEGVGISAKGIYHPLISVENVVENDAELSNGITIITGSNMSGKTTFLRTIAVNLVLAYIGAPVCAERLSAGYMRIFTSMRVTDDVANGISTFYAEILRIKAMAEFKESSGGSEPMLCMVDEIFKGTNSADRIVGAKEAITRLAGPNSMVVVSTHDFELCTVEDGEHNPAVNYHFEEYYEGDSLKFDYKIRDGRCTTTNARAILKMAGLVRE
jgi:DNA mismatch repair ATPase MutS